MSRSGSRTAQLDLGTRGCLFSGWKLLKVLQNMDVSTCIVLTAIAHSREPSLILVVVVVQPRWCLHVVPIPDLFIL